MASDSRAPVVIIGAGFGGLFTALALAERPDHRPILLIEPQERFVFLPLLYELLSHELRSWEVAPRYDSLLASRGVAWLQDRVTRIDTETHGISTAGGRHLSYGQVVIATGSGTATHAVPGAAEHCLQFRSLADVQRLQDRIATLRAQARPLQRLAVVGGGASGVELACKLADELRGSCGIELLELGPTLLPQSRAFNREQALLALQRRDVRVRTQAPVTLVAADHLIVGPRQERLPVDGVIWTAGIRCQPPAIVPAAGANGCTGPQGRLRCHADLRVVGLERVFALGDVAHLNDEERGELPSNAQVAVQQARCLAANLQRSDRGEPLQDFSYNDLGEMLSLGRGDATLTGAGLTLAGRSAFVLRKLAYLARLPGRSHRLKVAAGWLADW